MVTAPTLTVVMAPALDLNSKVAAVPAVFSIVKVPLIVTVVAETEPILSQAQVKPDPCAFQIKF